MADMASMMERADRNRMLETVAEVAAVAIDQRLLNMEQRQSKLAVLNAKLLDTLDVADRAAAIIVAKMQEQKQGWISVETAMPSPGQWYVGLAVHQETNWITEKTSTVYRMLRAYPNENQPADPLMRFWFPLPDPINNTEVTKVEKEKSE